MQTAIFNGHYALATLLVDKGADVNDGSLYIVDRDAESRELHAIGRTRPTPRTA